MTRDMAGQMNEPATHMEQGKMDKDAAAKMQERMKAMNQKLDTMEKDGTK